jgi:predicted GTPase
MSERVLILGAAGRDFHNFNVHFRGKPAYRVVAFTAAQIPNIAGRRYRRSSRAPSILTGFRSSPKASWSA